MKQNNKILEFLSSFLTLQGGIRLLLSTVFFFSAISKQIILDEFELYLYGLPYLSWNQSLILSRLILSIEYVLALLFLFNIFIGRTSYFTLLILAAFTLYLIISLVSKNEENCFCFGNALPMGAIASIFKNLVLMVLTRLLLWKKIFHENKSTLALVLIIIAGLLTPTLMWPPDFILTKRYKSNLSSTAIIPGDLFNKHIVVDDPDSLVNKKKKLVCFFSMGCKFCKSAARRIHIMEEKSNIDMNIIYVFFGKEENLNSFWESSQSDPFPFYICPPREFFKYSGKSLPAMFLVEDTLVNNRYNYRTMKENEIIDFFREGNP